MDENAGIVRNAQRRLCKLPKIRLDSGQTADRMRLTFTI